MIQMNHVGLHTKHVQFIVSNLWDGHKLFYILSSTIRIQNLLSELFLLYI